MSWKDDLQNDLTIRMGNGQTFSPKWLPEKRSREFIIKQYEFPGIDGTLVDRRRPKGQLIPLTLVFDGEDHITRAKDFDIASFDQRPWTLTHPWYGVLTVQPVSGAEYDNTSYNVTRITLSVMETIRAVYPQGSTAPQNAIANQANAVNASLARLGAAAKPTSAKTSQLNLLNTRAYNEAAGVVPTEAFADLYDAYNEAISSVTDYVTGPLEAIENTQKLLFYPANFDLPVKDRLKLLVDEMTGQLIGDTQLTIATLADKLLAQTLEGTIIAAICQALASPQDADYVTRSSVLTAIGALTDQYNIYLTQLDAMQSINGGQVGAFIPDAAAILALDELVSFTLANLFSIAIEARQERSIILEDDSNWIIIAHRLLGLTADDSSIEALRRLNNSGLNEILQVRKGRKIIYYI